MDKDQKNIKNIVKTYDFDEFSIFLLRILLEIEQFDSHTMVRWSSSGVGLHVRTKIDLSKFQDQNRQYWNEVYGYVLTFQTKKGKKVGDWMKIERFLYLYFGDLIKYSLFRMNKYVINRAQKVKKSKGARGKEPKAQKSVSKNSSKRESSKGIDS